MEVLTIRTSDDAIGCYRYAFHPQIATSNPPDYKTWGGAVTAAITKHQSQLGKAV